MALALAVGVATTTTIATLEEEEVNRKAKQCRIQFHPGEYPIILTRLF